MKSIITFAALLLMASCSGPKATQADNQDKLAKIRDLIASGNYVFHAQNALPSGGATRQLTSEYDLRVSKDTIVAYLPYFGRAYTAPVNLQDGGIQFTSTMFDYKTEAKRKGGWDISIKFKDGKNNEQMNLSVGEAGYASLQVSGTNRQPISFNGYIEEKRSR